MRTTTTVHSARDGVVQNHHGDDDEFDDDDDDYCCCSLCGGECLCEGPLKGRDDTRHQTTTRPVRSSLATSPVGAAAAVGDDRRPSTAEGTATRERSSARPHVGGVPRVVEPDPLACIPRGGGVCVRVSSSPSWASSSRPYRPHHIPTTKDAIRSGIDASVKPRHVHTLRRLGSVDDDDADRTSHRRPRG